ncbi:hypothetical protein [Rossellomorea vietnamensis]|uniref:hypothetical protein n=1 Tax=Rossellomorea vietnamensis TaxID=218284 RepID=UPI0012DC68AE|nr:hypothetical protein [Rossellomorea vietnamensis]
MFEVVGRDCSVKGPFNGTTLYYREDTYYAAIRVSLEDFVKDFTKLTIRCFNKKYLEAAPYSENYLEDTRVLIKY